MTTARTSIIPDFPSDQDDFHGEGHKRSALALAHAVEQFANRDGAIGLEGQWGAGKSTVINLAEQQFKASGKKGKQRRIFTFDLWVHQPELLKLAFLEEFIAWALQEKRLSQKQAEEYLERITDREITTRIENKREFSAHGVVFLLLAPLLPIAYTWLSPLSADTESTAKDAIVKLGDISISGLTLALLAVLAVYGIFVSAVAFKYVTRRPDGLMAALSAGARLFSKETDYDKITQSIRERNPTSEEFQTIFRRVLSDVQKDGNPVVFVFDNIDRLPSDIFPKVWSETRSIFSMKSRGTQPPHSNVVAIVCCDPR